jgi:hypothetical protein
MAVNTGVALAKSESTNFWRHSPFAFLTSNFWTASAFRLLI